LAKSTSPFPVDCRKHQRSRDKPRLKFSPIAPNDLQTLIDLGYVEMKDEVPTVTIAGLDEIAIGNLPSDRGGAEGEK
jgi:hypothetical protein